MADRPIDPLTAPFPRPSRSALDWRAAMAPVARALGRLGRWRVFDATRAAFRRLAEAGTAKYPPDVKRRLKILNMMVYLIVVTTLIFEIQLAAADATTNAPAIVINLALVVVALLVPLAHRLNEIAGGLLLVAAEYVALFGLTAFFGREGGTPLHYIIGAAAPFVVFGLKRLWLVLGVVTLGLALHIATWFAFPQGNAMAANPPAVLDPLYVQSAITTVALIAASVYYAFSLAERAKAETDALLRNILPGSIVERLHAKPGEPIADACDEASILFADISGFVPLARRLGASRTVALLNEIVSEFDQLAARHKVEKIKTIGDAYMAASGVPEPCDDHAERLARMALDMLRVVERLRHERDIELAMRIGVASGPVMAGVIGKQKFSYDVWGDAVNLAARLENLGQMGRVHICPTCRRKLDGVFAFESRGEIDIKGVGRQETWLLAQTVPDGPTLASAFSVPHPELVEGRGTAGA